MAPRRPARGLLLLLLFVGATIVMAFPSITSFTSVTPGNYGDAFFSQWLLQWDVHGLLTRSASVFHPNVFWPARDTLVYSDSTLAAAPLAALAGFLVGWPVAYNVLYLAGWVASLASAYALARWLGASRTGSVLASFVFTFAAVRLNLHGNFPMLSTFLAPLALLLLLRFLEERRWWQAVALGISGGAVLLNIGYLAVVLFPALAIVAAGWLIGTRFRTGPRFFTGLLGAATIAAVLAMPVLLRLRAQGDLVRPEYVVQNAATPRNFLAPADGSLLYGWLERWAHSPFENRLFPGFAAIVLGGVGAVAVVTRRLPLDRRRQLVLVLVSTVPALVLSFGKFQTIGDHHHHHHHHKVTLPYSWVANLTGYKSIRSFGRLTVLPLLGLALLAAFGYDRLVRDRDARAKLVAGVVLGGLLLCEYKARIDTSARIDTPVFATVNRALRHLPPGVVLELPMGDVNHFTYGFVEAPRMVLSAIDWNPRVNGYSGYSPPGYAHTVEVFNALGDGGAARPDALALLDELNVRYIVVRLASPDPDHDQPGIAFDDEETAARVVAALPSERVVAVTRQGAALLVQLRPAT